MIILLLIIFFLIVLFPFVSRKLSPIPYFPSNKDDLPLILKALNLRNGQTIVDLGAGDGVVVFEAAKQAQKRHFNTKFVAVEINPVLVLILQLRRLLHPNKKKIKIIFADMFKFDVSSVIASAPRHLDPDVTSGERSLNGISRSARNDRVTIFLYISPWFMEKVYKKLKGDLKAFHLISYFYPLKNTKTAKTIKGKNNIFIYEEGL